MVKAAVLKLSRGQNGLLFELLGGGGRQRALFPAWKGPGLCGPEGLNDGWCGKISCLAPSPEGYQQKQDEQNEEEAIMLYKQAIQLAAEEGDFTTRRLLEEILAEEETHIDRFGKLLVGMTEPFTQIGMQ